MENSFFDLPLLPLYTVRLYLLFPYRQFLLSYAPSQKNCGVMNDTNFSFAPELHKHYLKLLFSYMLRALLASFYAYALQNILVKKSPTKLLAKPHFLCFTLTVTHTFITIHTAKEDIIIYEKMLAESLRLDKEITQLREQLKKFPAGKLICTRNQNRYKWYQSDGHKSTYIPKKNQQLAEQLAIKKFLTLSLEDCVAEKRAIQYYLNHHHADTGQASRLLTENSEYKNLLIPHFNPLSEELSNWMYSSYSKNPKYPEQLIHKSSSNNLLRSKSEAMIDMLLHTNKIPFRYECALQLGEMTLYPDFTIRHPKTGQFYYWEHFGMMDHSVYSRKVSSKLDLYISHGIIPSIHLITTYETLENPLSFEVIQKLVEHYFL